MSTAISRPLSSVLLPSDVGGMHCNNVSILTPYWIFRTFKPSLPRARATFLFIVESAFPDWQSHLSDAQSIALSAGLPGFRTWEHTQFRRQSRCFTCESIYSDGQRIVSFRHSDHHRFRFSEQFCFPQWGHEFRRSEPFLFHISEQFFRIRSMLSAACFQ